MKRKFKLLAVAIAAALTIGSITLVSCDKETPLNNSNSGTDNPFLGKSSADIPYYPSFDSLYSEINIACSYSNPLGLWKHQNDRGILSIGATSDVLFDELDPEDYTTVEEALGYYTLHTDWLDTCLLKNNEVAIVPKWFFSEFRYVANQNGMFRVKNYVYKIFKNGVAASLYTDVETLYALTEDQLATIDTTTIHYTENTCLFPANDHPSCEYDWSVKNDPNSNSDRIHIKLNTSAVPTSSGHLAATTVHVYNLHKWGLTWWASRHNLTLSGSVTFHTVDNNEVWSSTLIPASKTGYGFSLICPVYERPCDWNDVNIFNIIFGNYSHFHHYQSFSLTASYPGHTPETFSFN